MKADDSLQKNPRKLQICLIFFSLLGFEKHPEYTARAFFINGLQGMEPQLASMLRELRRRLQDIYGERLLRVVLFGSQARGDAEFGSDIDVMVILRGTVSPGREIARTGGLTAEISLKHDVVISTLFISANRYAREKSPLMLNVRREGIAL